MTTHEIRKEVDARILAYAKIAVGGSLPVLLDERDWFIGMLTYIGEREANIMLIKAKLEKQYESIKYSKFLEYKRPADGSKGFSEKEADYKSRAETLDLKFDYDIALAEHKILYGLRERILKQVDSVSQRISVLRREYDKEMAAS